MAPETYRLATVIEERREARKMSWRDLADATGEATTTLHRNVTRKPENLTFAVLLCIAKALDLRLSSLIRLAERES